MQRGLIFNGILKVPMQFFILLIGVMVFVFYQFNSSPLHFNPSAVKEVMASEYASEYQNLETQKTTLDEVLRKKQITYARAEASSEKEALLGEIIALNDSETDLREQSKALIKKANPNTETNDKDYVCFYVVHMKRVLLWGNLHYFIRLSVWRARDPQFQ